MSTTEEHSKINWDVIDANIIPDLYVTWIVDIWQGHRHDPATTIMRYLGVWRTDQLEKEDGEAVDPDLSGAGGSRSRYGASEYDIKPRPIHWTRLETIKLGDSEAESYKESQQGYARAAERAGENTWQPHGKATKAVMYTAFLDAIDVLASDPTNEAAWAAVDEWRGTTALENER